MKIILAPNSFKGTLTSGEAGKIMAKAAHEVFPSAALLQLAIADGGEGTIDAFLANARGAKKYYEVKGPNGTPVKAALGLLKNHKAIVEIAQAAGLALANPKDPLLTTTYGVGELIDKAISLGNKEIIIALGGSATNDAGAGMAAALGTLFFDAKDRAFVPVGGTLSAIAKIDDAATRKKLSGIQITVMCDVKNPLDGKEGAAYVYARQKGADDNAIQKLDEGLRSIATVIKKDLKTDVSTIPGAGAAGGLGAGCVAFLGGRLVSGIDVILDLSGFDEEAKNADLIVTGEGSFDTQSLMGKGIDGLLKRKPKATKLIVIAGRILMTKQDYEKAGIYAAYATAPEGVMDFSAIKKSAPKCLYSTSLTAFARLKAHI